MICAWVFMWSCVWLMFPFVHVCSWQFALAECSYALNCLFDPGSHISIGIERKLVVDKLEDQESVCHLSHVIQDFFDKIYCSLGSDLNCHFFPYNTSITSFVCQVQRADFIVHILDSIGCTAACNYVSSSWSLTAAMWRARHLHIPTATQFYIHVYSNISLLPLLYQMASVYISSSLCSQLRTATAL